MSPDLDAFRSGYLAAFRSYLRGGGETGLETAYELGREAVAGELSLLELAGIHHEVLADCLASAPNGELERIARAGTDFFRESLSTFEMIQRGFGEAQETARLEQRHAAQLRGLAEAALSLSSALSEEEMLELLGERACAIVGADRSAVSMVADGGDGPRTPIRERGRLVAPLIDRDERALGLLELTGKRDSTSASAGSHSSSRAPCSPTACRRSPEWTPRSAIAREGTATSEATGTRSFRSPAAA
jgi:hypothetical protein